MLIYVLVGGLLLLMIALWMSRAETARLRRTVLESESLRAHFIASVSHEFRTPLSSLNASLEILSDDLEMLSRAEVRELLNSLRLGATGLSTLVDNLLDSTSIKAGHFSIAPRTIVFNRMLGEAIVLMQPLLDRRNQSLTIQQPFEIPSLKADPNRLRQVLINLLTNASKYSPLESVIDLMVEAQGENLRIVVADRGGGISEADRARLFQRFVRLDTQGEQPGLGLGLSVVKAIVEGHGGDVGAEQRPGGGSLFWFTVPLSN